MTGGRRGGKGSGESAFEAVGADVAGEAGGADAGEDGAGAEQAAVETLGAAERLAGEVVGVASPGSGWLLRGLALCSVFR